MKILSKILLIIAILISFVILLWFMIPILLILSINF